MQDVGHLFAKVAPDVIERCRSALDYRPEQNAQHSSSRQTNLLANDECRLQVLDNGIDAEGIALEHALLCGSSQVLGELCFVSLLNHIGSKLEELALGSRNPSAFLVGKCVGNLHFL